MERCVWRSLLFVFICIVQMTLVEVYTARVTRDMHLDYIERKELMLLEYGTD